MRTLTIRITMILVALFGISFVAGCDYDSQTSGSAEKEAATKAEAQNNVISNQPAHVMPYSPTRHTIDAWGEYWKVPGRLAYVYLTDGPNDHKGGYYVMVGPPVSYCVGLTSPVQKVKVKENQGDDHHEYIPAPGIDSVFGGGDCSVFYGIDAVTKLPFTFNVGMGQNMQYFPQPNLRYDANPLGAATFDSAKK